jgi:hypothetical protein
VGTEEKKNILNIQMICLLKVITWSWSRPGKSDIDPISISVETTEIFDVLVPRADVLGPERTSPLGSQNINRARALGDE